MNCPACNRCARPLEGQMLVDGVPHQEVCLRKHGHTEPCVGSWYLPIATWPEVWPTREKPLGVMQSRILRKGRT